MSMKQKQISRWYSATYFYLVIPLGLEPKTHSLEGCCSIQLSYGTPKMNGLESHFSVFRVQRYEKKVKSVTNFQFILYFCTQNDEYY